MLKLESQEFVRSKLCQGSLGFGLYLSGAMLLALSACSPALELDDSPQASVTPESSLTPQPSLTPDAEGSNKSPNPSDSDAEPSEPDSANSPGGSSSSSSGGATTGDGSDSSDGDSSQESEDSTSSDSGSDSPESTSTEEKDEGSSEPEPKVRDCEKIAWGGVDVAVGKIIARGDVQGYVDKNGDNKPERELVVAGMCEMHLTGKKCGIVNFGRG